MVELMVLFILLFLESMSEGVEMKEMATSEVKVEEQGASLEVVVEKSQPKEENTVENDTEKASSVEN